LKARTRPSTTTVPIIIDEDTPVVPEDQWPKIARLSTTGGLTQQNDVIREICRDVIKIVEVILVTQDAWPELHKGTHYKRQVLLDAVNALRVKIKNDGDDRKQDKQYKALRDRISNLKDEKFVRTIVKWVCDSFLL
jgi:hypothetical protein